MPAEFAAAELVFKRGIRELITGQRHQVEKTNLLNMIKIAAKTLIEQSVGFVTSCPCRMFVATPVWVIALQRHCLSVYMPTYMRMFWPSKISVWLEW